MDRRSFLGGVAALAALGWPVVAGATVPDGAARVSVAYREAVKTGKLLLIFVVPTGDPVWQRRYARQHAFGELLTWADDVTRARLGSCVLVAATMDELAVVVPQADEGKEPVFVVIDPRGVPARALPLGDEVPELATPDPDEMWRQVRSTEEYQTIWEAQQQAEGDAVDARVAALSRLLAVLPGASTPWDGSAPAGSSFWIDSACGAWPEEPPEEDDTPRFACGMGHVAAKSYRFLNFFTQVEG